MHPAEIKAALAIKGFSQVSAADACGVTRSAVSMVVNGRGRSKQVEDWIAAATGRTLLELWPQWYGEGELTLSDDERQLVLVYRDLSAADRHRLLGMAQHGLPREGESRARGHQVFAGGGSIAAGGSVHIGPGSGARKK